MAGWGDARLAEDRKPQSQASPSAVPPAPGADQPRKWVKCEVQRVVLTHWEQGAESGQKPRPGDAEQKRGQSQANDSEGTATHTAAAWEEHRVSWG